MKLEIGQTWVSESHPHESFRIYDGIEDSFVLSDIENYNGSKFDGLPEKAKIYFWERINKKSFDEFVIKQKGFNYENTYPYAWAGESKKGVLINKIKKYDMSLVK